MASIDDFLKLDIRVGRVTYVGSVEKARKPVYKLTVDFGAEIGSRTIVAGIREHYAAEELVGKEVACIVNLEPKSVAGVRHLADKKRIFAFANEHRSEKLGKFTATGCSLMISSTTSTGPSYSSLYEAQFLGA